MLNVFVEVGRKKSFAGVIDWPGWCRWGRDERSALVALADYGPRYKKVFKELDLGIPFVEDASVFVVTERVEGDATTSFGAPAIILESDRVPAGEGDLPRWHELLEACWRTFDHAVGKAEGKELRKGPRGGGRDLERILSHVLEGDQAYLRRLAWKPGKREGVNLVEDINRTREEILKALEIAVVDGLPDTGPRGGLIWPVKFFVRRVAWHILDHAWEIEDRMLNG